MVQWAKMWEPCGCTVTKVDEVTGMDRIEFCPLHVAAADLLQELEALRGQMGYLERSQHVCNNGMVCEAHVHLGWPHDDCSGAGMPCRFRKGYGICDFYHPEFNVVG